MLPLYIFFCFHFLSWKVTKFWWLLMTFDEDFGPLFTTFKCVPPIVGSLFMMTIYDLYFLYINNVLYEQLQCFQHLTIWWDIRGVIWQSWPIYLILRLAIQPKKSPFGSNFCSKHPYNTSYSSYLTFSLQKELLVVFVAVVAWLY